MLLRILLITGEAHAGALFLGYSLSINHDTNLLSVGFRGILFK